jgi:hypothetical protein
VVEAVRDGVQGRVVASLCGDHPCGIDEAGHGRDRGEHGEPRPDRVSAVKERRAGRVEGEDAGEGDRQARDERQVSPLSAGGRGRRERDDRDADLLEACDPGLGPTELCEQAGREDDSEERPPAGVEDLVARLVDEAGEAVDQVDEAEVRRPERERDGQCREREGA